MTDGYNARKTVLLRRGQRGYGFNLAEEYPCYLSAVHDGGVAWSAGLRSGDRLAGVGSIDVSNLPHKDIVRMIAEAGDALRLTVLPPPAAPTQATMMETRRAAATSSESSSSDCDSDNEIWRKKKSDLAQKLQQKRPRRSRYKNLITPISEVLMEDNANGSGGSGQRKRGKRYISINDQRATMDHRRTTACPIDQPIFDDAMMATTYPRSGNQFADHRRIVQHAAMVHSQSISPPEAKHAKRRPVSVLHSDDPFDAAIMDTVGRCSRSPAKTAKRRTLSGNGKHATGNRSSSAPDYKRTFHHSSNGINEASTMARVGEMMGDDDGDEQFSSDGEEDGDFDDEENASNEDEDEEEEEDLIKKSVVVYIGAVPVSNAGASRKNILKSALQSLRAQRVRAHTVLLEIFSTQIVITNSKGVMTNRFRADRIAYATSCAENKQYFGLATFVNNDRTNRTTTTDEMTDDSPMTGGGRSESDFNNGQTPYMVCHVFAVDPQLHLHSFHYHYARKFGIHCVRDPETNFCQEFPYSSNSILHAIGYVYRNRRHTLNRFASDSAAVKFGNGGGVPFVMPAYISSNSDSGIGNGREDFSPSTVLRSASAYPATPPKSAMASSEEAEKEKSGSSGKKTKAVRFLDDHHANGIEKTNTMERIDQLSKMDLEFGGEVEIKKDLLETVSDNPITSTPASRKDSKDPSGASIVGVRQTQPSAAHHHQSVSSSAVDVRQLVSSINSKGIIIRGSHKGQLGATKSVAVGQILAASGGGGGSGGTGGGSAGEIRSNSPKNLLGGSIEQLSTTSSSISRHVALSSSGKFQFHHHQTNIAGGSASSLFSNIGGDSTAGQQIAVGADSKCSSVSSVSIGTKHGSLLRDRINRRLNRGGGGDQTTTGIRTTSVRMKQALKERLETWSTDFDRLLRDPGGLYAFSEFLRTQYCQENVNFWIACENYKLSEENTRTHFATELYRNYFATGCMEPVNVDSLARQTIQEAMETENFTSTMFNPAQYQIFHLMKYDCYPRFLKSDEYQRCWESCEKGQQLAEMKEPFLNNVDLTSVGGGSSSLSLTTKSSCGGEGNEQQKKSAASTRKSILPWKNKFSGGVNIIGRHKGKKEDDTSLMLASQQPSTSASCSGGVASSSSSAPAAASGGTGGVGGSESVLGEMNSALSSVGSKRKQAWRHSKQLSTPADVAHAVRKPSGSVEGLHHLPMQSRPSSGLTVCKPDVIPQPDPPSSPSPGPHPRNAAHLQQQQQQQAKSTAPPGSPLLTNPAHASSAEGGGKFSCTLILPTRERVQTAVSEDLTVRRWLHELAQRYSLNAAATDIIDVETNEPVDLATNASRALAGKTVRLEGGVLFKVDLPCSAALSTGGGHSSEATQRKLIAVKARADSAAGHVLRPILNKYGLQLDSMVVCVAGTNEVLPNHSPISTANNKKLMVLTQNEFEDWVHRDHDAASLLSSNRSSPSRSSLSPSFEDIIGAKYFQELPSHKGLGIAELPPESDVIKSGRHHHHHHAPHHSQPSTSANGGGGHKHGPGGMLKFVKRGAAEATSTAATKILGQQTKSLRLSSHPNPQQPLAASTTAQQVALAGRKSVLSKQELLELAREEKRLAELLGRAQASSFDDQRGSSVKNFELPDFLKQPTPVSSHLTATTGGAAGAQSSSMDDSLIPTSSSGTGGGTSGQQAFYHSRPTDLVHRKLCGGGGLATAAEESGGGLSTASGSCEDDFGYEPLLTDRRGEDDLENNDELLKCSVTINGENSELLLGESKIPTQDEADALFGGGESKENVDFSDPMMTERRRLSDFGLSAPNASATVENLDNTIRSASIDERVSTASIGQRAPPPPYQRPPMHGSPARTPSAGHHVTKSATDTGLATPTAEQRKGAGAAGGGASSVGDVTSILDQEKKRKGLYVHHQDDDWQVDYV